MFTMVGYYDATSHAALAAIAAIADPHVRVSGNDIYVPALNKILGVFAGGADLTDCRLQSPSLRRLVNQRIEHVYPEALPPGSWYGQTAHIWKERGRTLDVAESLNAFCINAGSTAEYVFIWLMDKLEALPAGEIVTIEATATRTDVAANWVNGALTLSQTLPAGRYAIVGMRAVSTATVAARLVFPDFSPRPGVIGSQAYYTPSIPDFRYGGLGSWGEFEHDAPPTVDTIANVSASVPHIVQLDLIQVRAGRS
ncbi:hypothetical protein ES703_25089 [subsurface metagenome]